MVGGTVARHGRRWRRDHETERQTWHMLLGEEECIFLNQKGDWYKHFCSGHCLYVWAAQNFPQVPDAAVGCCCLPRYLILDVYKVLGRDSMRRRNVKPQVAFFRSPGSFPNRQTGEEGHNVGTDLLKGRSPLCGQRENVIGKRNVYVGTQESG